MLETIAIVLLVLWALGFFLAAIGPIIHLLLVVAVVAVAVRMFSGRSRTVA